jgi:hypothetical protein
VTGALPTAEGSRRTTGSAERATGGVIGVLVLGVLLLGVTVLGAAALVVPAGVVEPGGVVAAAGAAAAAAVDVVVGAVGRDAASRPASARAPAAWRITRLPADQAWRRTVAGASTPPAIRPGPAAATTSGPRTDDSSELAGPVDVVALRSRSGVASLDTTLDRPTDAGPDAEATAEPPWLWPIGVRRTSPAKRDCWDRSCHEGRATRRIGVPAGAAPGDVEEDVEGDDAGDAADDAAADDAEPVGGA